MLFSVLYGVASILKTKWGRCHNAASLVKQIKKFCYLYGSHAHSGIASLWYHLLSALIVLLIGTSRLCREEPKLWWSCKVNVFYEIIGSYASNVYIRIIDPAVEKNVLPSIENSRTVTRSNDKPYTDIHHIPFNRAGYPELQETVTFRPATIINTSYFASFYFGVYASLVIACPYQGRFALLTSSC